MVTRVERTRKSTPNQLIAFSHKNLLIAMETDLIKLGKLNQTDTNLHSTKKNKLL